jgi:peptidoglycan lytic transglycosylase G
MIRALLAAAVLLGLAAGGAVYLGASALREPADPNGASQVFWVNANESLEPVARRLDQDGLLPRRTFFGPRAFALYAKFTGKDRAIKSGEYDLAPSQTPIEILDKLVIGQVKMHEVTLPEGLRLDEVAARLQVAGIADAEEFLARAHDPVLCRRKGLEAASFEGYLYPETYRFHRDTPAEEILSTMLDELRRRLTADDFAAIEKSGLSFHDVVTLASIVEKESVPGVERPRIAAVYRNRLQRGMRLQSDPTVIYGVLQTHGTFDGNLRIVDLREDNPWNTYTRVGLPPGPIANPSIDAIRAVLHPEEAPYLYFVSRNDGTHQFSSTLTEHNRAVQRYQARRQAKNDVGPKAETKDGKRR